MVIKVSNSQSIQEAAQILRDGGLVGMPTETVYGLAANALDGEAVAKVFAAKGRPAFNPLIIHVSSPDMAARYVEFEANGHGWATILARSFWPGPLTMILPRKSGGGVSELASAGLDTLAVRIPNHPAALNLLRSAKVPLAAPSANKSGSLSPTTPAHVHEQLGACVDMILAGGACEVGLESTVVDLSGDVPLVLRPGGVSAEAIGDVLGMEVGYADGGAEAPKSPGMLLKHYAPSTPVRINAIDVQEGEALLAFGSDKFMVGRDFPAEMKRNLSENQDLYEAAANLFSMLKELDGCGACSIAVMAIPEEGIGRAINDRLKRAAAGSTK